MTASIAEDAIPRVLRGMNEQPMAELRAHVGVHGPLPDMHGVAPAQIIALTERAGLCGRGGAAFPAAIKMRAVSGRRGRKIVVANGAEGEPASRKDRVLLRELPHLVLDGVALAARAVGADTAIVAFPGTNRRTAESLTRAVTERRDARLRDPKLELVAIPEHWLAGQETALVNVLNGGPIKPTFGQRPFQRGVAGRATLMHNVETLAHLALIARHGPAWFRELGSPRAPGSRLVTLSGALAAPGVYEIDPGMPLSELLELAGVRAPLRAVLLGGYFGTWLSAPELGAVPLDAESLAAHDASLGAGVIVALDDTACPVAETARVTGYLASRSSGQCGPCVNGLDAIAGTIQALASGTAEQASRVDLARWLGEVPGRGACQHPDGATRLVASALSVFAEEFADHARHGPCERCTATPVLPVPLVHAESP